MVGYVYSIRYLAKINKEMAGNGWPPVPADVHKMNAKEVFKEMEEKALSKNGKYDYILLSREMERYGAIIFDSGKAPIRNALIVAFEQGKRSVWNVENHKMKQCPEELAVCIKSLKKLVVCTGDRENDTSYHLFCDAAQESGEDFCIVGVVEADEYVCAFSYDWLSGRNYYVLTVCEGVEQSDLYAIMKKLYEQGGVTCGTAGEKADRENVGAGGQIFRSNMDW